MVTRKLKAAARRDLGDLYGTPGTEANLSMFWNTCPVCGKRSVYSNKADRLFHADGSDNLSCWAGILRTDFDLHDTAQRDVDGLPLL